MRPGLNLRLPMVVKEHVTAHECRITITDLGIGPLRFGWRVNLSRPPWSYANGHASSRPKALRHALAIAKALAGTCTRVTA